MSAASLLDARTVIFLSGTMSGLMTAVFYTLKRKYPAYIKGLGEWSAAMLTFFIGGVLLANRGDLPDVITTAFPIFLIWCGLYLAYLGTQRFLGVEPRVVPWALFLLFGLAVQSWFSFGDPSYAARMRISNVMMAIVFGCNAHLVFKHKPLSFAKILSITVSTIAGLVQIMRFTMTFFAVERGDLLDPSPYNLVYLTCFAFSLLLFSIATIVMTADRLFAEVEYMACHDSLTHALTRRHMNVVIEKELASCRRSGRRVALLMMDLDYFKSVNDTYGHPAGDQVLIDFAGKVKTLLRQPDHLGRFGGEEFMALLPDTLLEDAVLVAERIRAACATSGQTPSCTVSIGVAICQPNDVLETMVQRADAALYRAKTNGRNRVEMA